MRIIKVPLKIALTQDIQLPQGSDILSCQVQGGVPCIWVLIKVEAVSKDIRTIEVYKTEDTIPDDRAHRRFINTIHVESGDLIFHVFERRWDSKR